MRRIELIPQTKAAINQGKVFYHFSAMRRAAPRAPSPAREHQICFFESHFAEMKYGWISGEAGAENPNLQFMVGQQSRWKTEWLPGVWHNIAFEIVSRPTFFPPVPLAFFLVSLSFGCRAPASLCRSSICSKLAEECGPMMVKQYEHVLRVSYECLANRATPRG